MTATAATSSFERLKNFGEKALENPDAVGKLVGALKVTAEAVQAIVHARTERVRIRAAAEAELAHIHSVRDVLLTYLDRSFDERRHNFEKLFETLDRALEANQLGAVARTLEAVVALAAQSPFKDLADAAKAARILKDRDHDHVL